jgi:hypothetical protein
MDGWMDGRMDDSFVFIYCYVVFTPVDMQVLWIISL